MAQFRSTRTKLVFVFLEKEAVEPSTNSTNASLLRNLTHIKTFASGILVPKSYIWPVTEDLYLQPHTSLVLDAHNEDLEVFASGFANDIDFAYNYSHDPVAEYLSFIENEDWSVDGVLSDFPTTPSAVIGCLSHLEKNQSKGERPLVISIEGASGNFPGCTDLAYKKAVNDGVDVLDCPVQITRDGVPFCLGSINLNDRTTVAASNFSNRATSIPELNSANGVFSFNLTWSEIQTIRPAISNIFAESRLYRNPENSNRGSFTKLSDFLSLANHESSLSGVLIIENAPYLAENVGFSVTDAVLEALEKAGYSNQTAKKVMILSSNSSVLTKFKERSSYERVCRVNKLISDVDDATILDIRSFADSVVVRKLSIFVAENCFMVSPTKVVPKLRAAGLRVYTQNFHNEFMSQLWDFMADATMEINTFAKQVDGIFTSFPATSARYKRNRCLGLGDKTPSYMKPIEPGALLQDLPRNALPPAEAPPPLTDEDVGEPPLPTVVQKAPPPTPSNASPSGSPPASNSSKAAPPHGQCSTSATSSLFSILAVLLSAAFMHL